MKRMRSKPKVKQPTVSIDHCHHCGKPLTWTPKEYRQLRVALELSQRQLAEKLGVKASHVAYIEGGSRRPSHALHSKYLALDRKHAGRKLKGGFKAAA